MGTVRGSLQMTGGMAAGPGEPIPGEIYVFTSVDRAGPAALKTKTAGDGSFVLSLPAGTYYLAASSPEYVIDPAPSQAPCGDDTPTNVHTGQVSDVTIGCDRL